eukprot:146114_1
MALHSQIDSHKINEGWLYKKGQINTSWKKRYFVLYDDRTIDYFKDKSHSTQRTKAKGTIYLTQIQRVELVSYENPNDILNTNNEIIKDKSFSFKDTLKSENNSNNKFLTLNSITECVELKDNYTNKNKTSSNKSVNGWCTLNNNNNAIISSITTVPDYNNIVYETEKQFAKERALLSKSLLKLKTKHNLNIIPPYVNQSQVSPTGGSSVECELTDIDDDFSISNSNNNTKSYINKSIISDNIKNYHRKISISTATSVSSTISSECSLTPRDEYDAFQIIMNDTKLNLKCNRRYSFALI